MPSKVGAQSQSETNKHGRAYKAPWHEAVPKKRFCNPNSEFLDLHSSLGGYIFEI